MRIAEDRDRYLVVVPTYNERENIARILPAVLDQNPLIDVLVVDDGSPDGTGEYAAAVGRKNPRINVLQRQEKNGLGRAYLDGFSWGLERGYGLFIEMDADFSHRPDLLPELIEKARDSDIVIGSRYVGGMVRVVNWPIKRLLLSYLGSMYARAVTGIPVMDATGGFNCFRRRVLKALDLSRIESNGYAFQIEMKYRAWRSGFVIVETPIVFVEREVGESKMSGRIVREALTKVWKLRFLNMLGRL